MKKRFTIAGLATAALIAIPVTAWAVTTEDQSTAQAPCGIEWEDMTGYMSDANDDWSEMRSFMEEQGVNPGAHMSYGNGMMGFGPSRVPQS